MRKLLLATLLLATNLSFGQNTTFMMTSQKNDYSTFDKVTQKWITQKRTYENIEIDVTDGVIFVHDNLRSTYTPNSKSEKKQFDGYSTLDVYCLDKNDKRCLVRLYKLDDESGVFMLTIEYDDAKFFYFKER